MATNKHRLMIVFLLIALGLAGCGPGGLKTKSPTKTPRPTRTFTPTATVAPTLTPIFIPTSPPLPEVNFEPVSRIYLEGWEDTVITHLCLKDLSSGVTPRPAEVDVITMLEEKVAAVGIPVTSGANSACDGFLTLTGNVNARSATYTPGGTCYSGYSIVLDLSLTAQDKQAAFRIERSKATPYTISACNSKPENAPFPNLDDALNTILEQIWGPQFNIVNLYAKVWDSDFLDRVKRLAPDEEIIALVLTNILSNDNFLGALELIRFWGLTEAIPYLHADIHSPDLYYEGAVILMAETLCSLEDLNMNDLPPLLEILKNGNVLGYEQYSYLFSCIQPPEEALAVLLDVLEEADRDARAYFAKVLVDFGEPAYEYVIPMLEEPDVRENLEEGLKGEGYQVIAPLLAYADQTNDNTKKSIVRILQEVSGKDLGNDLADWQNWWQALDEQMTHLTPEDYLSALSSEEKILQIYTLEKIIEDGSSAMDTLPVLTEWLGVNQTFLTTRALISLGPGGMAVINQWMAAHADSQELITIYYALASRGAEAMECVPALIVNLSNEYLGAGGARWPSLVYALRKITGQNFGADADAWRAWWEAQN
jgi:hypothetical protein